MSLLAGHTLILQIDRETLLDLIQGNITMAGTPIQAPFRLRVPRPGVSIIQEKPLDVVDVIVKSVRVALTRGTRSGHLSFAIEAGVVRLGNDETPFTGGEVRIAFEFQDGTLLSIKLLTATLHAVPSQIPDFANRANVEINKLLDKDRDHVFPLFELEDENKLLMALSKTRVIDDITVGVFLGMGDANQVPRAITTGNSTSLALSADFVRDNILCRALLRPEELDPEWRRGGPTDLERTRLPAPCGSGSLPRGTAGMDIRVKEVNFAFQNGSIGITGKFDARDADCWEVNDGSFSQSIRLDVNPTTQTVTPRVDPPEPNLNYQVTLRNLCKWALFFLGVLGNTVGALLIAFAEGTAIAVMKALFRQQQQPSTIQTIAGTRWQSVAIFEEGLLFQGEVAAERFSDSHQPSRAWLTVFYRGTNFKEGNGGEAVYQAPMCEPRLFKYRDYSQDDGKFLRVEYEWLIEPVRYQWFINGTEIPHPGGSPLKFPTAVRTALPPPDGYEIPGHAVELAYDFETWRPLIDPPMRSVLLRARVADLCYSVRAEMKATDGAGRVYWVDQNLKFTGVWVEFGPDYEEYRSECFGRVRDVVEKKSLVKRRLKPGEPQEEIDWIARYIQEYVDSGSPEVAQVIDAAVKMQGVAAVNTALAKRMSRRG
jgi:hypothetical protein